MFLHGVVAGHSLAAAGVDCSAAGSPIYPDAVNFDGTNDYLRRDAALTGASDNKLLTFSMWLYKVTADNYNTYMNGDNNNKGITFHTRGANSSRYDNFMIGYNSAGTAVLGSDDDAFWNSHLNEWVHIMCSLDLSDTGKRHFYINGAARTQSWANYTNDTMYWEAPYWTLFARSLSPFGSKHNGDAAEMYITNEYIDLSVQANREKFISGTGTGATPVDLGTDGSCVTGTTPLIYFSGTASTWNNGTNSGSGGDFVMNGSVTDSGNEPVDLP